MPISYRAAQTLIKRGDAEQLSAALDAGLSPQLANQNGWTLLMLAAVEGNADLATLLLNRGAATTPKNDKGETALDIATRKNHTALVELLRAAPLERPAE